MIDIETEKEPNLKNIRQIGTPTEDDKIYIENAAYARIHEEDYTNRRAFIFMGHTECRQGKYATFVEAAIPVRDLEFDQNVPRWNTHAWSDVFREIKRSYENSIIVGWALDLKGFTPRLTPELTAVHREQFGGAHQVFFLMDSLEGEEYFYKNRGNRLQQKEGFYIYYARELHKIRPAEVTFEVPRRESFQVLPPSGDDQKEKRRSKIHKKEAVQGTSKASSYAMAAAVALLVVIGCVGAAQGKISLSGVRQAVSTMGNKTVNKGEKAQVLVGSEIPEQEENETQAKETTGDTQTWTQPLDLIPIEEIPAGEIQKEKDTTEQTQTTESSTQTEQADEKSVGADSDGEKMKEETNKTSAQPSQNAAYYIVQEGDTLSGICQRRYGNIRNVKKIVELNGMENSDNIRAGQKLLLP